MDWLLVKYQTDSPRLSHYLTLFEPTWRHAVQRIPLPHAHVHLSLPAAHNHDSLCSDGLCSSPYIDQAQGGQVPEAAQSPPEVVSFVEKINVTFLGSQCVCGQYTLMPVLSI